MIMNPRSSMLAVLVLASLCAPSFAAPFSLPPLDPGDGSASLGLAASNVSTFEMRLGGAARRSYVGRKDDAPSAHRSAAPRDLLRLDTLRSEPVVFSVSLRSYLAGWDALP